MNIDTSQAIDAEFSEVELGIGSLTRHVCKMIVCGFGFTILLFSTVLWLSSYIEIERKPYLDCETISVYPEGSGFAKQALKEGRCTDWLK